MRVEGENALLGIPLTDAQMDEYRCACCKLPCASCEENFALEDLQDADTGGNEAFLLARTPLRPQARRAVGA